MPLLPPGNKSLPGRQCRCTGQVTWVIWVFAKPGAFAKPGLEQSIDCKDDAESEFPGMKYLHLESKNIQRPELNWLRGG